MKIYVKKVEGVTLPQKGTEVAAGYDIVATSDPKIVGEEHMVNGIWRRIDYIEYETNLFIAPSAVTFHTLIHPRSSISKYNLVLANSIGLVDNDYRGMVICRFKYIWQPQDFVFAQNASGAIEILLGGSIYQDKIYKKGDKIAQLVVEPTVMVDWELVDDLTQTARGEGGFGSTDKPSPRKPLEALNHPGKTLMEIFADADKKSTKPLPYSEQIKQRDQR